MQCDVCGTEVQPHHKFCTECGARLRHDHLALPTTGEVPAIGAGPAPRGGAEHPMFDPATGQLIGLRLDPTSSASPPSPAPAPALSDEDATNVLPAIGEPMTTFAPPDPTPGAGLPWQTYLGPPTPGADYPAFPGATEHDPTRVQLPVEPPARPPVPSVPPALPADATGIVPRDYSPVTYEPADAYTGWEVEPDEPDPSRGFAVRPLLVLTLLAAAAAVVAMVARVATIELDNQPGWRLNDFGTNLTVAGVLAAAAMVGGGLAWGTGFRWGAGLAGGAGAALAGWAALAIGAAETAPASDWPPLRPVSAELTREVGYWGLVAAGGLGLLVALVSLRHAGHDRRAGLDPWVAALGAIATVAAVIGPLIPLNDADVTRNWSSAPGTDLPTAYFAARFAGLGLLLVCGVFGFLLVRRYGLGLAIGSAVAIGWLTLTAATEQTDAPIGPAYWNPGNVPAGGAGSLGDGKPYVVTIAGVGLMLFFGVVAAAMALIDND